jgi:hypothetical protein
LFHPPCEGWDEVQIFCESDSDCTSEKGAGQFSIFGACEEKDDHAFSRIDTDQETTEGRALRLWMAAVFGAEER